MNYKVLAKGASHFFVKRCIGPFWFRRKWLQKTQWLSEEDLEGIQLKLLQELVRHCYTTVPYYRQLMRERGIKVEDIKALEDIKLFPILTKQDVLRAADTIISTKYPKWSLKTAYTGGTTGTPLIIKRDIFSIGNNHAFFRRQWEWAGIGLFDRCAYLTGGLFVKPDMQNSRLYAYDPFMKELLLSTYHLCTSTAKEYAEVMKKYEVKAIVGYPSAVHLLARTCLDFRIEMNLKAALTSSETLSESMKNTISLAFNCNVFDYYGSAERTCDIQTCDKGSYHIIPEYGITELIPTDQPDTGRCRIISTGFWNKAMPLIRHDMNDIVVKSERACPCGRQFPVIKSILGREGDIIKTPSGKEFGAAILTHLLYGTDHIAESQIIQDSIDHIIINYIPTNKFTAKDLDIFEKLIERHLPTELKVDIKQVERIKRTESGKLKPIVSYLTE